MKRVNKAIEFAWGVMHDAEKKSSVELGDGTYIANPLQYNKALSELLDKYVIQQEIAERKFQRAKEAVASAPVSLKNVTLNGFHALTQAFSPEMSALKDAERAAASKLWWNTTIVNTIADHLNTLAERQDKDIDLFKRVCRASASLTQ